VARGSTRGISWMAGPSPAMNEGREIPDRRTLPESELPFYRPAVGIMLLNRAGRVFVGRRIDMPAGLAAWQMPHGGIDDGETPRQAALRELKEEVGTDEAEILAESAGWLHYDVPEELWMQFGGMWGGRYCGQRQ